MPKVNIYCPGSIKKWQKTAWYGLAGARRGLAGGSHAQENETFDRRIVIIFGSYRWIHHGCVLFGRLGGTGQRADDSFLPGVESDPRTGGGSPSPMIGDAVWVDRRRLGLRRGDAGLDVVLSLVLQTVSCGGEAFVRASVRQDDGQCEGVQAHAVGGSVSGAHLTGVFGKEHISVAIVHTPMPAVVSEQIFR